MRRFALDRAPRAMRQQDRRDTSLTVRLVDLISTIVKARTM
jgi:hypothetical protein